MGPTFKSYQEFYRFYLTQHAQPWTRRIHFLGTVTGLLIVGHFLHWGPRWLALSGVGVGYAFAWFSHLVIEKNKPATFGHPLWSFVSDFRMLFETVRKFWRKG